MSRDHSSVHGWDVPSFILEFPNQVRIGEEFIVHVEYTITSNHLDVFPDIPYAKLTINYPKQIELVSTEYLFVDIMDGTYDLYGQHDKYTGLEFPENERGLNEVDIIFKITEPLPHEAHIFHIANYFQGERVDNGKMHASSTDDVLTLSPYRLVSGSDENKYQNRYEESQSLEWKPYIHDVGPVYSDFNSLSLEDKDIVKKYFKNRHNMTAPQSNDVNWTPKDQAEYDAWVKSTNQTR